MSVVLAAAPLAAVAKIPDGASVEVPFRVTADSLEYESERDIYVARGSALLEQGEDSIRADWMTFNNTTKRGVASGNVVVTDGEETLYTNFIEFDVENLRGVLFDGRFASSGTQFRLEGAEIAKTGEDQYHFEDGVFTTCRCPAGERDPWRIRADQADLEIGGYGTARNTTFDVLGVPIVWLPWMIYPLKTERQTGFLLPDLSLGGGNGFGVGLPFFWAARDELNVTLTPRWTTTRGFKGDVEVEYLLGEDSWVDSFAAYAHDEDIDAHSRSDPFGRDRWTALGRAEIHLPFDVELRSDVKAISDNDYVIDFDELRRHRSDRFLESQTWAGRSFGPQLGLVASTAFADDLQSPDDRDRDKTLLQRLPDVGLSVLPAPLRWLSWLVPASDVQYTYFGALRNAAGKWSDGAVVGDRLFVDSGIDALPDSAELGAGGDPHADDFATAGGPEGDGLFQEGEPLADRGHRLRLTPRIGVPLRFGDAVELYPEVGWHQTLYQTEAQSSEQWGVLIGRADLRTRLARRFAGGGSHVLEPRIGWAILTKQGQSGEPLFVPPTAVPQSRIRQLDLENVVLDPADRKRRFNGVTWGLANRIFGSADEPGGAPPLLADFELSGEYEFYDGDIGTLFLDGRAYPWQRTSARFNLGFDPDQGRLEEALAEIRYASRRGHAVGVGYRYLRQIPRFFEDFRSDEDRFDNFESNFNRVNQVDLSLRLALTPQWSVTHSLAYSFENSLLLRNVGGVEYFSRCRCWAIRLEVRQDRQRDVQFNLVYSLTGFERREGPFAHGARLSGAALP